MDEKERELYFLREKSIKDEISALANAEEKGIQIGIEQGIKQGIQREKIETVLRLKSLGLNIEQIAKGTCITETEVEKIIKENINQYIRGSCFTTPYKYIKNYRFQIIKEGPQNGLYKPKSAYEEVVILIIFINTIYYKNNYQGDK